MGDNLVIKYVTNIEKKELEFLFELYASTRLDEIATWGWEKEQIQDFLWMQFQAKQRSYKLQYPNLTSRIIVFENENVGRILLAEFEAKLVVVDITLLPKYRNKGIGTEVLLSLISEARNQNKNIQLSVYHNNERAKRLYERLGFQQVYRNEMYFQMEWPGH